MPKREFSVSFRVTEPFGAYAADLGEHMQDSERALAKAILTACEVHWNGIAKCYSTDDLRRADIAANALRQYGLSVIVNGFDISDRPEQAVQIMHHIRAAAFSRELDILKDTADRDRARRFAKNRKEPEAPFSFPDTDEAFRT